MIDFWRFNVHFAQELYDEQPVSSPGVWNQMEYRALEGFVYAVTPFNFTAIGGNLHHRAGPDGQHRDLEAGLERDARAATTPCRLLEAAGMPPGVINFLPGDAVEITQRAARLAATSAGVHFTGSTAVFNSMWKKVGENMGTLPLLSAPRRRDRRQGLHRRACVRRSAGGGGRHRARRLRVPGPEVLGGQPRLRPAVALERGARPHDRDDEGHQDGRCPRLPQLHGRGHRQEGVHQDQRVPRRREEEREGAAGRRRRRARRATSSSRRSSRRPIPATACSARRSSGRS